jgi:hypothetical protein
MPIRKSVLLAALLLLAACSKVTQANYGKLSVGMDKAEVQALLGDASECEAAVGLSSCLWGDDKASISVQFAADKVLLFSAQGLK